MTRDFFNRQFAAMLAVYPTRMPEEAQDIYWQMLAHMKEPRFYGAVRACLARCKFFPTIAELIEAEKNLPQLKLKMIEHRPSAEEIEAGRGVLAKTAMILAKAKGVR